MNTVIKNIRIEFHVLQSFPVTCLNRDDVGAPKSAWVGGVSRARVSSQCWKRQVRLAMQDFGVKLAWRTKKVEDILCKACVKQGAKDDAASSCAKILAEALVKDTLLFVSESEAEALVQLAKEHDFDGGKIKAKEVAKRAKKALNPAYDALDIALFGRMVAKAPEMDIEAAASFSHAISTHEVANEVEFFTALDDHASQDCLEEQGSAHMGSLEFNAATYYRYISLDLGQLEQSLGMESGDLSPLQQAIEVFTKALYVAVPAARQTTQSGASPWEFAKVLVRRGQRLQVPFETPIKSEKGGGYLQPSIAELKEYLSKKESLSGSLFGKLGDYELGEDSTYSIDYLIEDLKQCVKKEYLSTESRGMPTQYGQGAKKTMTPINGQTQDMEPV